MPKLPLVIFVVALIAAQTACAAQLSGRRSLASTTQLGADPCQGKATPQSCDAVEECTWYV